MPDLILRHILPIKFIEVFLYRKVIKADYVVLCKMAKSILFIKKPIFVEKNPALGNR